MAEKDDAEIGNARKKGSDKSEFGNTLWKTALIALLSMIAAALQEAFKGLFTEWVSSYFIRAFILAVTGGITYYGYRLIVSPRERDLDDLLNPKGRLRLQILGWVMLLPSATFLIFVLILTLLPLGSLVVAEVGKLGGVLFPPPPKIEITAERETVKLGEFSELAVTVDGKDLPKGYRTYWTSKPELKAYELNHSTGRFEPNEKLVKPGGSEDVTITVTVKDGKDKEIGSASKVLKVVYAPIIKLDAPKSRVLVGGSLRITVQLNGASPPSGYRFVWTVNGVVRTVSDTDPFLDFQGEDLPTGKDWKEDTIEVQVFDDKQNEAGKAKKTITVAARSPFFVAVVFDASERMGAKDFQGMLLYDVVKKAVDEQVVNVHSFGGNFGLWSFGDQKSSVSGKACDLIEQVYPIGSDRDEARKHLGLVELGGKDAPLILAMQTAITSLADYQSVANSHLTLVTITGGDDTCRPEKAEEYLAQLRELIKASGFANERFTVKFRTFTIAFVTDDKNAARWDAVVQSAEYMESPQNLVFVARDPGILWATTAGIAGLHSPDSGIRQQAASQLKTLFAKQGDASADRKISAYVDDFEQ